MSTEQLQLGELTPTIDQQDLSESTLSAFKGESENPEKAREEYKKLAISALTICCTCD